MFDIAIDSRTLLVEEAGSDPATEDRFDEVRHDFHFASYMPEPDLHADTKGLGEMFDMNLGYRRLSSFVIMRI